MEMKCYEFKQEDNWSIFALVIPKTRGVALKYGKNDAVATSNDLRLQEIERRSFGKKEISISNPGMRGIPKFVIKDIFEEKHLF